MATYYWVGGTGTWDGSSQTNWATVSGGAGGNGPPNSADIVIFDSNSGTGTCTTASGSACATATLNSSTLGLTLGANHSMSGTFTLTLGTLSLGTYTLTCAIFNSTNTNTRSIAFNTGNITVTGNNATIFGMATVTGFTYTGTPTVNFTYSGATGSRIFQFGSTGGTETNALNFNVKAGSDVVGLTSSSVVKNLDLTGFSGTLGNGSTGITVYGDLTISSTTTITSQAASIFTFAATSGVQKLTSNGVTFNVPITQNSPNATLQLQDNLTLSSIRAFVLTAGTLDLTGNNGNWTLSAGLFSSSNSNTRSIVFGTGNITLTGNAGAVWSMGTMTGFTYTGTPTVNAIYAGATGTRTISSGNTAGATETNVPSFNISAGTDTVSVSTGSSVKNISFSGFSGTLSSNGYTAFGDVTFSNTMLIAGGTTPTVTFAATSGIQKLTTNAFSLSFPLTVNCPGATVQLQDDCNITNTGTTAFTLTAGTLDLGGFDLSVAGRFNSTTANARAILFGTKEIKLTGNNLTIINFTNYTNFSYTGTPIFNLTYSGGTGTRTISLGTTGATEFNVFDVYVSAGTDIVTSGGSCLFRTLDFTGFAGTFGIFNRTIYRNLTVSSGMTLTAGSNTTVFAGTSGNQQITTNGKTLDFPLNFTGVGGTYAFQDALTQGSTRAFTISNGTLQLKNGVTSTVGAFATAGTNQKFLQSTTPGSQATLSQASGTVDASYLTIRDINATGGATWNAYVNQFNIDAGNNDGWDFGISPIVGSYEYTYQLRSFTQPRRF